MKAARTTGQARFGNAQELFNDLEKVSAAKRAKLPRNGDRPRQFAKDWERLNHSGRYDMRRLKDVMMPLIANDEPLPPEYLDLVEEAAAGSLAAQTQELENAIKVFKLAAKRQTAAA
jgi:hypothetical protein